MLESATKMKKSASVIPDWSLLPKELLNVISENVEDCFDIVHARSVCNFWRSTFSFPCMLRRQRYPLPSFANFPRESKDLCTLEKIPLFLFRVQTPPASASDYFLGRIGRDESEDLTELLSSIQCSVKVKIPGSDPALMNMRDGQILPLGHQCRMVGCNPKDYTCLAFLPLNQEGGEEFIVLLGFGSILLVLTSSEMKWKPIIRSRTSLYADIVTFRRMFYATVQNKSMTMRHAYRIDPFSLQVTPMIPVSPGSLQYLVPCGNDDELFVVELLVSFSYAFDLSQLICSVGRLHEETGEWVEVSDLGDRVLFIGRLGNVSCSAKELPDGCGVSGNSILFTNELDNGTYVYKYDTNYWRFSGENRVTILSTSPVVSFRVEPNR